MERGAWPDGVEFWINQRVMVTGGAGFLGRHAVAKLREYGATQMLGQCVAQYADGRLESVGLTEPFILHVGGARRTGDRPGVGR